MKKHVWNTWKNENIKCEKCGCETPRTGSMQKYCKPCSDKLIVERRQPYYRKHREEISGYHKTLRETLIGTTIDGKCRTFHVKKRPYPNDNSCELCKSTKMLVYHHWDEIVPGKFLAGIWCCRKCHNVAEIVEHPQHFNSTVTNYILLKEGIDNATNCT